jgi:ribosome maturation factor RimP
LSLFQSLMKEQERIRELLDTQLNGTPYFVVEVTVGGSRLTPKVTIMLDGDRGIGIDACADASRQLDQAIEAQELFPKGYVLEVSSPGVDQPLKLARQYPQHVGRQLRVQLQDGTEHTGKLEAATGTELVLLEQTVGKNGKKKKETVQTTFALADVTKAVVLVSFK